MLQYGKDYKIKFDSKKIALGSVVIYFIIFVLFLGHSYSGFIPGRLRGAI